MIDFKKEIAEIIAKNLEGLTEDEIKSMIEIPQHFLALDLQRR